MLALIFSLIASLSYGSSDFLAGRTAHKLPSALIVLLTQGTQAILVLAIALWSNQPFMSSALLWGIIGGIANGAAYMLYYRALTLGKAGVVSPLVASSSAIPVIISLFMGTIPNGYVLGGLAIILFGVIGITYAPNDKDNGALPMCRGIIMLVVWRSPKIIFRPATCIVLALLSSIAFGMAFTIANHGVGVAGESVNWMIWGFQLGTLPITIFSTLTTKVAWRNSLAKSSILKALAIIMTLNMTGDFLIAYAFKSGTLGIVSVLGSLAPVVTILTATILLGEVLTRFQKICAAFIIIGTLLISYWH